MLVCCVVSVLTPAVPKLATSLHRLSNLSCPVLKLPLRYLSLFVTKVIDIYECEGPNCVQRGLVIGFQICAAISVERIDSQIMKACSLQLPPQMRAVLIYGIGRVKCYSH